MPRVPSLFNPGPLRWTRGALVLAAALLALPADAQEPAPAPQEGGRVAGQVIDRGSGRPMQGVEVTVLGTPPRVMRTAIDGRFRSGALPPGVYRLRASMLGYTTSEVDSVRVGAGGVATVDFALQASTLVLEGIMVQAQATPRAASEAGLLSRQRTAPAVSDGVSAQQMSRAPDADAGDAIVRVPGVAVVDDKFVVIRGLGERYGNTLLNGTELASPEPLKKIVPLDIFPAALLESIVTTKTATPDRPGDFAGGSVEITTREFPDEPIAQITVSQGFNSQSSFRDLPLLRRSAADYTGFDDGARAMPARPATEADLEAFGEGLRNVWTPAPRRALPDLGVGLSLGDRREIGGGELGFIASFNYSAATDFTDDRLYLFVKDRTGAAAQGSRVDESQQVVDWGALLNLAFQGGGNWRISWKNLLTQNAEEYLAHRSGFDLERNPPETQAYQVRYVERSFLQTQLAGEHGLWGTQLKWNATVSAARRNEPENRSLTYLRNDDRPGYSLTFTRPNYFWFRFLDDRILTAGVDWSIPFTLRDTDDGQVKVGGLRRVKDRDFDAELFSLIPVTSPPSGAAVLELPPEQALAPENIGSNIAVRQFPTEALPYESDDDLTAAYAMLDARLLPGVRLVAGVRMESWSMSVFPGSRTEPADSAQHRRVRDFLPSANLAIALGERMNLRLAASRTVARPDPREVTRSFYVAVTGECVNLGFPELQPTSILNADARWELYPRAGEIVSVAGFYKRFTDPIVEVVSGEGFSNCRVEPRNAASATNLGAELEFRKALHFLPGPLGRLSAGLNLTLIRGEVTPDSSAFSITEKLPLFAQSDFLVNASLGWADEDARFEASVLYNGFGDRVLRYGLPTEGASIPHLTEVGRGTLDARVRKGFGERFTLTLSGRNLTDGVVRYVQETEQGEATVGWQRPGISFSVGAGYDF